jgi:hypothetical protein
MIMILRNLTYLLNALCAENLLAIETRAGTQRSLRRGSKPVHRKRSRYLMFLTSWSRVLLEKLIVAQLINESLHDTEPEGSVPCSQEPAKSEALYKFS